MYIIEESSLGQFTLNLGHFWQNLYPQHSLLVGRNPACVFGVVLSHSRVRRVSSACSRMLIFPGLVNPETGTGFYFERHLEPVQCKKSLHFKTASTSWKFWNGALGGGAFSIFEEVDADIRNPNPKLWLRESYKLAIQNFQKCSLFIFRHIFSFNFRITLAHSVLVIDKARTYNFLLSLEGLWLSLNLKLRQRFVEHPTRYCGFVFQNEFPLLICVKIVHRIRKPNGLYVVIFRSLERYCCHPPVQF